MTAPDRFGQNGIWAITCYFNPMRYRRRLANFRLFRESLKVPLVAVELAYGPDFELRAGDAEILIQLRGGAVLWQKERLLNVALQALPVHCRKVAWLDCDIIFAEPNWIAAADALLDDNAVIQLFRRVHNLGPQWMPGKDPASELEFTQPSAALLLAAGVPAVECLGHLVEDRRRNCAIGLAWAAHREVLNRHLFYDACILGGGDRAMACAATQCWNDLARRHRMNERERQWYVGWAEPFYETVHAELAFLDMDIFHLWHGDVARRQKGCARNGFKSFEFDPAVDVAIDANGSWRWSTDKRDMHDYIRGFFAARMEDG
jgi:hypothetical protein